MYYCPPMAPAPPLRRKRSTSVCRRYSGSCSDKPLSLPAGMIHGAGLRATICSVYQRCWAAVIPTKCPKTDNPRSGCAAPVALHADHNPLPRIARHWGTGAVRPEPNCCNAVTSGRSHLRHYRVARPTPASLRSADTTEAKLIGCERWKSRTEALKVGTTL
jgi:hypothetical protein